METMSRRSFHGVEVDMCDRCSGLFLHRGELDKVAEAHRGDLEYSTLDQEDFRHDDEYGPIPCPACSRHAMKKVEFIIYTNIILDYCPACGGFWLDGREMDKINTEVRRLDEAPDGPQPLMIWFARFIWNLPQ